MTTWSSGEQGRASGDLSWGTLIREASANPPLTMSLMHDTYLQCEILTQQADDNLMTTPSIPASQATAHGVDCRWNDDNDAHDEWH